MKKLFALAVLALLVTCLAVGQGFLPQKGDIGVGAYVSGSMSRAMVFIQASDTILIAPEVGLASTTSGSKAGGTTVWGDPDTTLYAGAGVFFSMVKFENLNLLVGPRFLYSSETYTAAEDHVVSSWTLFLDARILAMLTKNLGIFTDVSGYYYSTDNHAKTSDTDSLEKGYGLESLGLGVTYFFK